jgi:hypothetical protein
MCPTAPLPVCVDECGQLTDDPAFAKVLTGTQPDLLAPSGMVVPLSTVIPRRRCLRTGTDQARHGHGRRCANLTLHMWIRGRLPALAPGIHRRATGGGTVGPFTATPSAGGARVQRSIMRCICSG